MELKAYLSLLLLRSGKDSNEKFKNSKHEGPNPFVKRFWIFLNSKKASTKVTLVKNYLWWNPSIDAHRGVRGKGEEYT
jgi:hypothetical protein